MIANSAALTADAVFEMQPWQNSPGIAWLGLIFYTIQLYFDFSGYSDMAVGLGRMFGFRFPGNFNYPPAPVLNCGGGGISRFRHGFGIMCIFRWAAAEEEMSI